MKSIKQELQEAIQNIADNHGVVIGDICIKWIDGSSVGKDKYIINRIEICNASVVKPYNEN